MPSTSARCRNDLGASRTRGRTPPRRISAAKANPRPPENAPPILGVINGTVEWIGRDHPDHDEIHRVWSENYESDPYSWGDGIVFFRIQPQSMWAYAFHPEEFPE